MMEGETKVCNLCGQSRPLDDFQRRVKSSEARRSRCRICRRSEAKRKPTGRSHGHHGLDGHSKKDRDEIRANYLIEFERKSREEEAMRSRLDRSGRLESDDWVWHQLGMSHVDVPRSRVLESLPWAVPMFEDFDHIEDNLISLER